MSKKLGEILIDQGKITEAQLQKALKAQLIFGGHLGTSLIELGYIDEDALGNALSTSFKVGFASWEILKDIPYAVVRAIPAKLVEKYKVVPIRVEGKTLQLAMLDPKNLMALDEISFVTGYRIEPWVSPEIRIYQVLEKYYNIPRSQRYITLAREMNKKKGQPDITDPAEVASPAQAAGPAAGSASPRAKQSPDHWEKYGYGRSWREYADEMERQKVPVSPAPAAVITEAAPETAPARKITPANQLEAVARRLQACTAPDEVSEVILTFAARHLKRAAFFVVRGEHAVGWGGSGEGFLTERIKGMNVPMVRDSLFSLAGGDRGHFLGAIPAFPSIRKFYQDLQVPMPLTGLIVPIRIRDKVASILYGDGATDDDLGSLDATIFDRLSAKASLALQMIIFRNKIASS
ncbi:MAG TPA: hypothetical protein VNI57_12465 [Candidatus Saccharimonadales bacterium]|nr:hypothetical protein [Candidatus Saccharimonadales bacterium]